MPADHDLEELASLPEFFHPVASPDGDRVAVYWNGTGRNELYLLDPATGDMEQISDGEVPKDATYPVRWDDDGERLFFHHDDDGDEQNDVHAIDLDGNAEVVVSDDGQCVLHDVHDGVLLYATTAEGQMNLFRHDPATGERERVTDYEQPVRAATLSPDGERVAYVANESEDLDNTDVYVASVERDSPASDGSADEAGSDDADGSDPRRLPVNDGGFEAGVHDWAPDGDALLVSDDSDGVDRVGVYDLAEDAVTWYGPGDHEETPVAFRPHGSGVLAIRKREAASVPVLYDRDGGAAADGADGESGRELALDEGVVSVRGKRREAVFVDDDTALLSYSTPDRRRELYRYDLASDEYEVLLPAEYGDIDPEDFVPAEYVTYEGADGWTIGALLYDPGEEAHPAPGVVQVHGGPHAQTQRSFNTYAQFLAGQGYAVLAPNYRGSTGRGREFKNAVRGDWGGKEQADVAAGGRWLADRDWVDGDRVAVFGGSYGGYSTYWQLVSYPELWATGVAWVGITDLLAMWDESMPHFKTILRQQLGDPDENEALWRERSPVTHVEDIEAPICIAHGVNDPRCPVSQARIFRDALEEVGWEAGEDFRYEELDEEGHGSTDIDQQIRAYRIVDEWLDERL